ncbi:uncharacterized protein J3R85_001562 [Psidium guajava]|nr:uncharacterized protein J3R85_001562 [Psidium guajava]
MASCTGESSSIPGVPIAISSPCNLKESWPELVGMNGDVATGIILRENPAVSMAPMVKEGSFVTADFRCDRVWVWVDGSKLVTQVPRVG